MHRIIGASLPCTRLETRVGERMISARALVDLGLDHLTAVALTLDARRCIIVRSLAQPTTNAARSDATVHRLRSITGHVDR